MELLRYIRIPINTRPPYGASDLMSGSEIAAQVDNFVVFEMQKFVEKEGIFAVYECTVDGCRGCGCPSFFITREVPLEILDHLYIHVNLCEGLVRSRVPQ